MDCASLIPTVTLGFTHYDLILYDPDHIESYTVGPSGTYLDDCGGYEISLENEDSYDGIWGD